MKEFLKYLAKNRNWWLVPAVVVFIVFGVLILVSNTIPVSAFIYTLF